MTLNVFYRFLNAHLTATRLNEASAISPRARKRGKSLPTRLPLKARKVIAVGLVAERKEKVVPVLLMVTPV